MGKAGLAGSSGPSSNASYCARPCWQNPTKSIADSSGGKNMRRMLRIVVRANEALRRSLEFIVHAPFGKHETRHTITIRKAVANGGCGHSFRRLTQAPGARGGYVLFADKVA